MRLNERLRIELAIRNMRPIDLVARVGCDRAHISRVLAGSIAPTPALYNRIVTAIHQDDLEDLQRQRERRALQAAAPPDAA